MYDTVIIGGGHNGLVCAAYLARAGLDVLLLERRKIVGGACVTEEVFPGYHVSTCAYLVHALQDKVVRDLDLYQHGYHVIHRDPGFVLPFAKGCAIRMWQDPERAAGEFEQFSVEDVEGFRQWEAFWNDAASLMSEDLLDEPPTIDELRMRVRGTEREALLDRLLTGTLSGLLDECFSSEQAKAAVVHIPFVMRPMDEPGVLLAEASLQIDRTAEPKHQGIPVGGMSSLSEAMARAAQHFGATVRTCTSVDEIVVEQGRAVGVRVGNEVIHAKIVVSNCDVKRTFLQLLSRKSVPEPWIDRISRLDTECGTIKFIAAINELPDFTPYLGEGHDPQCLSGVRICPSVNYYRDALDAALSGRIPDRPLLSLQIPTVYDPSIAPPGKHICTMWVRYYPSRPKEGTWDELCDRVGQQIIDEANRWAPNFADSIIDWCLYTPADLEERVGLTDGNIHHLHHVASQVLGDRVFDRGGYRTPLTGLYLCGASAHPGGEVSGAPGHNAAHAILKDLPTTRGG